MSINITLNFIRENWSSATRTMDRRPFCLAVLPDAYDGSRCENQGAHFFIPEAPGGLSDQTVNGLMRGNRKSAVNLTYASAAFTKDFLAKLQSNAPILFTDPQRPNVPCVENMISKIRALVRSHGTPRTRDHALFARMDFGTLGQCDEITLKAYRKQLLITPRQLEIFLETFRDYPWMEDFRQNYLPIFEKHKRQFYCFYEDELLSCSASDLPYEDRLRVLLALRSVDPPNDNSLHKFLRTTTPPKTHTILK